MRVECIATEAGLDALTPQWAELWRRAPGASPFQSPAWLLAWWRHFGTGALRILAARHDGSLVGLLPLYELEEPHGRKLLPIGIGLSDYIDALIDPSAPEAAGILLDAIRDFSEWRECHLPDLPPGAALAAARAPGGL